MAVHICGRFQKADRGQVGRMECIKEIVNVILVVRLVGVGAVKTRGHRWASMVWVGGGSPVLEKCVMGNVISRRSIVRRTRGALASTSSGPVRIFHGQV